MKSVADILPEAVKVDSLECNACGNLVEFKEKQWRRPCSRCGTIITLPQLHMKVREESKRAPACFLCNDQGMVYYKEQVGKFTYEFAARCVCRAGEGRHEQGLPRVNEVDNICSLEYLEMKNRKAWEERTGRKADPALFAGSEEVKVNPEEIPF